MSNMAASTVTIDKAYFETLLRRAQFHASGVDFTTPVSLSVVTIPKLDHDNLLNVAREHANLRRNLIKGGATEETISILINDDGHEHEDVSIVTTTSDGELYMSQNLKSKTQSISRVGNKDYTYGRSDNYRPRTSGNDVSGYHHHDGDNTLDGCSPPPDGEADCFFGNNNGSVEGKRPHYQKNAKRSIQLSNLPEGVSHSEILGSVKGGLLLDIFLRTNDRSAAISFLEEDAAKAFLSHVKRHDLYIRGKRVEIRWNERQFMLPGHVAHKIYGGATRNFVIRNIGLKHTENSIRDDLDHIHNLVVIKLTFKGQDVHVSTNSVHNAIIARTCMMSRASYKSTKFEWDADECAVPIETIYAAPCKPLLPKKSSQPLKNRFELLNIDVTEDDSIEDDENTSGHTFQSVFTATAGLVV